jgi:AhpD family alkylhydroperoxidase
MALIAPLAEEQLDAESLERIAAGMASGMYTTTLPLRIMARAPAALRSMDEGYKAMFRCSLLDDRLRELLRLQSAILNGCGPCSVSRKEDAVGEEEIACLANPDATGSTRRERLALRYMTLMATDHFKITADTYRELAEEFSAAEIVELGWTCASTIGGHRFIHSLDVLGDSTPVIR